jgi:hypothetical protein
MPHGLKLKKVRSNNMNKLLFVLFFLAQTTYAWDCHPLFTYGALKNMPEINHAPTVPAETLTSFLQKEHAGLVKLLDENEQWSRQHITFYPPLPATLRFNDIDNSLPIQTQFIHAIRVNPDLGYPLFVQYLPGNSHKINKHPLVKSKLMAPSVEHAQWICLANPPLEGIMPGEELAPLDILTTASDEPDYGMDIHLWQDNPSAFGKIYGFGMQPFGSKVFPIGSQAPFHMGFYYESAILFHFASFLQHSYPEYRIHLYLTLSRYAFKTGHPYWGYRFLGWAIHYAQDLTQPYHSTVAPNTSTLRLLYVNVLDMMGSHTAELNILQLISNRHFSLENYVYYLLENNLVKKIENDPVSQSLSDQRFDSSYPAYTDSYPRQVIAKESHEKATKVDQLIMKSFPSKYVSDPNYVFYTTEPDINLFTVAKNDPNKSIELLNEYLPDILRPIGSHTRNVVRYVITPVNK